MVEVGMYPFTLMTKFVINCLRIESTASLRRRPESRSEKCDTATPNWIPAYAGMTDNYSKCHEN